MEILEKYGILSKIDHAALKPTCTKDDIDKAVAVVQNIPVASLCIHPSWLRYVVKQHCPNVVLGTVVGFPLGASSLKAKCGDAQHSVENGALELDIVINIGWVKSGLYDIVKRELEDVMRVFKQGQDYTRTKYSEQWIDGVDASDNDNYVTKVILEMCYLTQEEKKRCIEIAVQAGADYVKTSTGFGEYGAKVRDIELMRNLVPDNIGIKASGGIKTLKDVQKMIEAGATRIGTSSTLSIAQELGVI